LELLSYLGVTSAIILGLYLSSLHSYLLFHNLIELITVAIGFSLYILSWNARRFLTNDCLKLLGIGYAFIAIIDLIHTLAYKGMTVFPGYDSNLPTQLWISARYLQAATLLVAPLFVRRKLSTYLPYGIYSVLVSLIVILTFSDYFPTCFVEGQGLTPFKINSEYVITAILCISLWLFHQRRSSFSNQVYLFILASIICTIVSELTFTTFLSLYGFTNMLGHLLKLAAFYLIYRAILVTGFKAPLELIFNDLKQAEASLREANDSLEENVRKRTAELRANEEKYRTLIESANDAVFIHEISADGVAGPYTEVNELACRLLGYSTEEFARMRPTDLDDPRFSDKNALAKEKLRTEGRVVFETALIARDARSIPVEVSTRVLDLQGTSLHFSLVRDITERKRVEEELRKHREHLEDLVNERTTQLVIAKEQAEAANRAKSLFLANMSHELRTPLNAVLGFSHLMKKSPEVSAEQRKDLEVITNSGQHLLNLINDVLDMSKIESGRLELEVAHLDLYQLLQGLKSLLYVRATEKGLDFSLTQARDLPRHVAIDGGKLRQVLINLLGNAMKYTASGGVILHALVARQESGARVRLRFEVEDSGQGIDPEDRERIFLPFVQLENRATAETGTGLGLAICKQYVELMDGRIDFSSEPGKGSRFWIEVPATLVSSAEIPAAPHQGRVTGLAVGQAGFRLLIAEDQPENRQLLRRLLDPLGLELREATNGQEAVALFEDWQPHLILMDIRMPLMDGLEATRRIKTTKNGKQTRILAVTAHALKEERAQIMEAGCDDFIQKPFSDTELFAALSKHLGLKFLYAEKPEGSIAAAPELSAARLAALPVELVSQLHQAVVELDTVRTLTLIEQIGEQDASLGEQLGALAQSLDYNCLLRLLEMEENKPEESK
jgi:PAS domain S-box-containing protein